MAAFVVHGHDLALAVTRLGERFGTRRRTEAHALDVRALAVQLLAVGGRAPKRGSDPIGGVGVVE